MRLADRVQEWTGVRLDIHAGDKPHSDGKLIIVATAKDDWIKGALPKQYFSNLGDEGFVLRRMDVGDQRAILAAGSTLEGAHNAVSELLSWKLRANDKTVTAPGDLDMTDKPAMRYRVLWSWDSMVNFSESVPEMNKVQQFPADVNGPVWFNKNSKEVYLKHFKRAMAFAADHKFNAYIIWGFLRDETGGLETGRELSKYAKQQGVRVLPGVCTENAYGGFTFSKDARYNLDHWTKEHPDLRFKHPRGGFEPGLCPSKPENIHWLREGTKWFYDNLPDVGGMNIENGDWMQCDTPDCNAARAKEGVDHNFLWDQWKTYTPVLEESQRLRPDAWNIFATYIGFSEKEFTAEMQTAIKQKLAQDAGYPPHLLKLLPQNGIAQWTFTAMAGHLDAYWPKGAKPPENHLKGHIGLLHQGSVWGAPVDPKRWWAAPQGSLDDTSVLLQAVCARVAGSGLDGLVIKGQVGPASPANELNYVAMEYFTWHPERTWEEFEKDRLSHCYGGQKRAQQFLKVLRNLTRDQSEIERDREQVMRVGASVELDSLQKARWKNLADELTRRLARRDVFPQ
jgi:hypothetical protein